jgi:hypothetical protein
VAQASEGEEEDDDVEMKEEKDDDEEEETKPDYPDTQVMSSSKKRPVDESWRKIPSTLGDPSFKINFPKGKKPKISDSRVSIAVLGEDGADDDVTEETSNDALMKWNESKQQEVKISGTFTTMDGKKVYKAWIDIASNKQATLLTLLKAINQNLVVIQKEINNHTARSGGTHGARSVSLLAALRTYINNHGGDTASKDIFILLPEAIALHLKKSPSLDSFQKLAMALGNTSASGIQKGVWGGGIMYEAKKFRLTTEKQLRGRVRTALWRHASTLKQYRNQRFDNVKHTDKYLKAVGYMTTDRKAALKKLRADKETYEQNHPISFEAATLISFSKKLIASNDLHDKILLVQLTTGSRWIEVVAVSQYWLVEQTDWEDARQDMHSSYYGRDSSRDIVVQGIAKGRKKKGVTFQDDIGDNDKNVSMEAINKVVGPKPVLFVPPKYIQYLVYNVIRPAFRKLDSNINDKNLAAIAGAYNPVTNARLKTYDLAMNVSDRRRVHTHTLRKIYANFSYDLYASKAITKPAWIRMVLGHKPTSFMTSLAYNTASIFDAPPQTDEEKTTIHIANIKSAVDDANKLTELMELWKKYNVVESVERVIQNMSGKRPLIVDTKEDKKKIGKIPFIGRNKEVFFVDAIPREGVSHVERETAYKKTKKSFSDHGVTLSYDNFQRVGFGSAYIAKRKKAEE